MTVLQSLETALICPPAEHFKLPLVRSSLDIWVLSSNANNSSIVNMLERELEKGWESDFSHNHRLQWNKTGKLVFSLEEEIPSLFKKSNLEHITVTTFFRRTSASQVAY